MKYPIAVQTNFLDMRILSQKSCFTIHGIKERDFEKLFEGTKLVLEKYFYKYVIPGKYASKLYSQLKKLGVGHSTIFPDLEGLATELEERFKN